MTAQDTIDTYYRTILRREPSPAEVAGHVQENQNGASLDQIEIEFLHSAEAQANVDPIVRLYQVALNRLPDSPGLTYWSQQLGSGALTLAQIADAFSGSAEFHNLYGADTAASRDAFVTDLYHNAFNRQPDAAGLDYWTHSGLSDAQILAQFAQSPEFEGRSQSAVDNVLFRAAESTQTYDGALLPNKFTLPALQGPAVTGAPALDAPSYNPYTGALIVSGHGDAGTTVNVYVDNGGQQVGSVRVGPDGSWKFVQTSGLTDGNHTIYAAEQDAAGHISSNASETVANRQTLAGHVTSVNDPNHYTDGNVILTVSGNELAFSSAAQGIGGRYLLNGHVDLKFSDDSPNILGVDHFGSATSGVTITALTDHSIGIDFHQTYVDQVTRAQIDLQLG